MTAIGKLARVIASDWAATPTLQHRDTEVVHAIEAAKHHILGYEALVTDLETENAQLRRHLESFIHEKP